MSRLATAFVLGYHGCERTTAEVVLASPDQHIRHSERDFDWLGPGAYFWESDPRRALEWATKRTGTRAFERPFVVGAVIDLRNCLDLTVREDILLLGYYFESLKALAQTGGVDLPENIDVSGAGSDKLFRYRDCAVINAMHDEVARAAAAARRQGRLPAVEPFDTVRGMFQEGAPAFEGAGIASKTHTQIAVINDQCIRGYFRPRPCPSL